MLALSLSLLASSPAAIGAVPNVESRAHLPPAARVESIRFGPEGVDLRALALETAAGNPVVASGALELETVGVIAGLGDGGTRVVSVDLRATASGVPILDRRARVTLAMLSDGRYRAVAIASNLESDAGAAAARRAAAYAPVDVPFADAAERALSRAGITNPALVRVSYGLDGPEGGPFRPVVRVLASSADDGSAIESQVDVGSREVRWVRDVRAFADGAGQYFEPNPVQRDQTVYADQGDSAAAIPFGSYVSGPIEGLDGTGFLRGDYADGTPGTNDAFDAALAFVYLRNDKRFEQASAYHQIDAFQRRIQSLGFASMNASVQRFDAHGTSADNSWYDPVQDLLVFGDGGVDDAEDPEIVLHEYGHAIHDAVGALGPSFESRAVSEGYGDYFAATAASDPRVGEWDAVSYSAASPIPYLRRVDGNKSYPQGMTQSSVHADGEIWSAALWDLRNALGPSTADRILLQGMISGGYDAGMQAGAAALLAAESLVTAGAKRAIVEGILENRGLLAGATLRVSDTTPLPGQGVTFTLSGGEANATYLLVPSLQLVDVPLPGGKSLAVGLDLFPAVLGVPGLLSNLSSAGSAVVSFTMPPSPACAGLRLYWQYVSVVVSGGGAAFGTVSNPLVTSIHDKA